MLTFKMLRYGDAAPPAVYCGLGWQFEGVTFVDPDIDSSVIIIPGPDMVLGTTDSGDVTWVVTQVIGSGLTPTVTPVSADVADGWSFNAFPETEGSYSGAIFSLQAFVNGVESCNGIDISAGGWYFLGIGPGLTETPPGVFDPVANYFLQDIALSGGDGSVLVSDTQWIITQTAGNPVAPGQVSLLGGTTIGDGFQIQTNPVNSITDNLIPPVDGYGGGEDLSLVGTAFSLQLQIATGHDIDDNPIDFVDQYPPVLIRSSSIYFEVNGVVINNALADSAGCTPASPTIDWITFLPPSTIPMVNAGRVVFDSVKSDPIDGTIGYIGAWSADIIIRGAGTPPEVTWDYSLEWNGDPDTMTHANDIEVTSGPTHFLFLVTPNFAHDSDDPPVAFIKKVFVRATHIGGPQFDVYPVHGVSFTMHE